MQSSWLIRCLPARLQRSLVNTAVRLGLSRLARLDADGPDGERLRARFRALLPGQEPHYRFLGIDLGFAYTDGAVIPESTRKPEAADPVVDYSPTTWPGARLPHLWVRRGKERLALFDLLDGERFLLLVHPPGRQSWCDAATDLQKEIAFPIACLSIGTEDSADLVDEHGVWPRLSEVEPSGAVLVRPDGHVAWRCAESPRDPHGVLINVMKTILCVEKNTANARR